MKQYSKHIAIVIFLVLAQIGAFTLKANAQQLAKADIWVKTWADTANPKHTLTIEKAETVNIGPNGVVATERIADETIIYKSGSNTATIECDNEIIAQKLLRRYDQIIKRCTWGFRKDRHGSYRHYLIVVSLSDAQIIKDWSLKNL